jgi:adenylate kinase
MGSFPIQVILLGPPGAGKGTQARRLAERLGLAHISPGRLFRESGCSNSPEGQRIRALMAAGELVPDELADRLVRERLESLAPDHGFILDGYPRTAEEARFLRRTLSRLHRLTRRPLVVWLEAPHDVLIQRLRDRSQEQHRPDDSEEAIERRLEVWGGQVWPLRDALKGWTDQLTIDARRSPDEITDEILARLCSGPESGGRPDARPGEELLQD